METTYHYIDDTVKIDFHVSKDIKYLMDISEKADLEDNYGAYENFVNCLLYTNCKEAYVQGHMTKEQWETMERRYLL